MVRSHATQTSKLRGGIYRAAALVLSLAVACISGELGLRLAGYSQTYLNPFSSFHEYDPALGCRGKANFSGRFRQADFDVVVAHNDLGFRRQEQHPELPVPSHNVFVLGDSFVWGYGVGQSEVITDQMSTRLRRMGSLGPAAKQWSADPGHAAQTVHACGKLKSGNTCHGTWARRIHRHHEHEA